MAAQVIPFPRRPDSAGSAALRQQQSTIRAEVLTEPVNLNRALCGRESYGLMAGETNAAFGITAGDLLIIDATLKPRYNDLVAYDCDGGYLITLYLREAPAEMLGVVRFIVHVARGGAAVKGEARREG
jgi:hypothetical protein